MKIGVLGGTFDPPHLAHIALAKAAIEHLGLDELMFLPAFRNPLKTTKKVPAKQRLDMVQLAIEKESKMSASDIEIARGGLSYAYDTIHELSYVRPADYWFILGADAIKSLSEWKQPMKLLKMCRLGAVQRPGENMDRIISGLPDYAVESVDWIEMPQSEISSSKIRQRIRSGQPVSQFLNPNVFRYIEENKLYRS